MVKCGALLAVLLCVNAAQAVEDRFPHVAGAYIVKRDGRVLWAAAEHERHAPASLTKMMTALLVLERNELDLGGFRKLDLGCERCNGRGGRARGSRLRNGRDRNDLTGIRRDDRVLAQVVKLAAGLRTDALGTKFGFCHRRVSLKHVLEWRLTWPLVVAVSIALKCSIFGGCRAAG